MKTKLGAALVLSVAACLHAQENAPLSPAELEEASGVAVHTADALAKGRTILLREAIDSVSIVGAAVGTSYLPDLTPRQNRQLSDRLLTEMAGPFSPMRKTKDFCRVLAARGSSGQADVALLMPTSSGELKTDWKLRLRHGQWLLEDIVLSDTARSIRQEAIDSLGPAPIAHWRRRDAEARAAAWPRAAGVVAVVLITGIFLRRLSGTQRLVILSIAAVPATLFAVDGYLSISQIWNEPVEIRMAETTPRNRALHRFQAGVSARDWNAATSAAGEAAAAGAAPQPLHFVLGRLAEELGRLPDASREFDRSLEPPRPAPGAWAGLARIAFQKEDYPRSVEDWDRYLEETSPDPSSLILKSAALARSEEWAAAQDSLARAIAIDPGRPEAYDLSSRIAAMQGDAAAAIARLREEEKLRSVDRAAIARDAAFAPLAENDAWKAYLAESPPRRRPSI